MVQNNMSAAAAVLSNIPGWVWGLLAIVVLGGIAWIGYKIYQYATCPKTCGANGVEYAGLCYPRCRDGFTMTSAGVCTQVCPDGYYWTGSSCQVSRPTLAVGQQVAQYSVAAAAAPLTNVGVCPAGYWPLNDVDTRCYPLVSGTCGPLGPATCTAVCQGPTPGCHPGDLTYTCFDRAGCTVLGGPSAGQTYAYGTPVPSSFDMSSRPRTCPDGTTQVGALCYQNCLPGFTMTSAGLCTQQCPPNYTWTGSSCQWSAGPLTLAVPGDIQTYSNPAAGVPACAS